MLLIQKIRAKYPNPVSAQKRNNSEDYCVGGAFCKYVNGDIPFPSDEDLADMLERQNPNLANSSFADEFATDIIFLNDTEDFQNAWDKLEEALSYGG